MKSEGRLNPEKVLGGPLLPDATSIMPADLKAALAARGYVLAAEFPTLPSAHAKKKSPKRPPKDKMIRDGQTVQK